MICILGDIHFSSAKDYFAAIGNAMLGWFRDWKFNKKGNELLLVGDIVHSSVNGGIVIDFVERLYQYSSFDRIHIIPGNHDLKRRDGVIQLAYEFLRNKDRVSIYDRMTAANIQGHSVLMLPHYIPGANEPSMNEAYSKLHLTQKGPYTLAVGHFMEESMSFGMTDTVRNLDKLNTKHLCLGHLHIRSNPEIYIGSMYANKINEGDPRRAAWIIDETGNRQEDLLPVFCDYLTAKYPDPLPSTQACVPVYTITNCVNEKLARALYGDIYIRKIIQQLAIPERNKDDASDESAVSLDPLELFKDFMKTTPTPLDRRVATLCLASLKTSATNLGYDNDRNFGTAVLPS